MEGIKAGMFSRRDVKASAPEGEGGARLHAGSALPRHRLHMDLQVDEPSLRGLVFVETISD